jgi:hypothetical protein
MSNAVYDDQDSQEKNHAADYTPGDHDDLGVRPEQREAEVDDLERQLDAPSATEKNGTQAESSKNIAARESATDAKGFYTGTNYRAKDAQKAGKEEQANVMKGVTSGMAGKSSLRKKAMLAGAAAGGSLLLGILVFLALLPLKINGIINNLESQFMATSKAAISQQSENMFSHYITAYVLAGLAKPGCTSTAISKDCVDTSGCKSPGSPVCKTYQGWKQSRMEYKLATKYGVEFGNSNGRFYMKAPGLPGDPNLPSNSIDITDLQNTNRNIFDLPQVTRNGADRAMREALRNATFRDRVMFRFSYNRFIKAKYGHKFCTFACDAALFKSTRSTSNNIKDSYANRKQAFKLKVIERVGIRSALLATSMNCLIDPRCKPTERTGDGTPNDPTNGEQTSDVERRMREELINGNRSLGRTSLNELAKLVDEVNTSGSFRGYVTDKLTAKLGVNTGAIARALPIVGWVNLAAVAVGTAASADEKVKALGYALGEAESIGMYEMMHTLASEQRRGFVDSTMLGSMADAYSAGGVDMTAHPAYASINGAPTSSTNALLDSLLPGTAFAASSSYTCPEDGKTPAQHGSVVCPAESLNYSTSSAQAVELASEAVPSQAGTLANAWNDTAGAAISGVSDALCSVPGPSLICQGISSAMSVVTDPLMEWGANTLFPSRVTPENDGGRNYVVTALGAASSGYQYAHRGLGAQALSDAQATLIIDKQLAEERQVFAQKPLFARMFDTESSHSFVSRLAMGMPTNALTASNNGVASLVSNPLERMSSTFASAFSKTNTVSAASTRAAEKAMGVLAYGYPETHPVFSTNPEEAWESYGCANRSEDGPTAQWNRSATIPPDSDTGQAVNTTANPCLLLEEAAVSGGAAFNAELIPKDAAAAEAPANTNPGGSSVTVGPVTGSPRELAGKLAVAPNITWLNSATAAQLKLYSENGSIVNVCGIPMGVSPYLSGALLALGDKYKISISNIGFQAEKARSCERGTFQHPKGNAIDIQYIEILGGAKTSPGLDFAPGDAAIVNAFAKDFMALLPKEGDQYIRGGVGQVECGVGPADSIFPTGSVATYIFEDSCDHLHIDVRNRTNLNEAAGIP